MVRHSPNQAPSRANEPTGNGPTCRKCGNDNWQKEAPQSGMSRVIYTCQTCELSGTYSEVSEE